MDRSSLDLLHVNLSSHMPVVQLTVDVLVVGAQKVRYPSLEMMQISIEYVQRVLNTYLLDDTFYPQGHNSRLDSLHSRENWGAGADQRHPGFR